MKVSAVLSALLLSALLCLPTQGQPPAQPVAKATVGSQASNSALLANFPIPVGAARKSFTSNRHSGGSWQELALYALTGSADRVADDYAQQIARAGWLPLSSSATGTIAARTYRAVADYGSGSSKAHIVVGLDPKLGVTVTSTITTNFPPGTTPSLSLDVTAAPSTGATSSPADQGAADPAAFPRLPGSLRSTYDASVSGVTRRENAKYTASGGVSNAEAFFSRSLPQAQWTETYRFIEVDDVRQAVKVDNTWQSGGDSAALTLSSGATGGTTLFVTVTRNVATPAQPLSLPGAAPGAGVMGAPSTPANAPPPLTSPLLPPSPAITGLSVQSSSPVAHTAQWDCVKDEWLCGNSGKIYAAGSTPNIPIFEYAISSRPADASQFEPISPSSAIAAFGECLNPPSCTQTAVHVKANFTAYITPNTTIRVVRTDKQGKLAVANADFVYASPPQPQQPGSFSASEPQFGQVKLTWTPIAGPTRYLISEKGVNAPPAQVPNQPTTSPNATIFRNVSPGSHTYRIVSDYGAPPAAINLPEVSVLVHRVPPLRGVPFLTKNNGAGSEDSSVRHLAAFVHMNSGLLCPYGGCTIDESSPFGMSSYPNFAAIASTGAAALYANVTELALGRSVRCWENTELRSKSDGIGQVPVIVSIDCLAANHGALVGAATPNANELTASAGAGSSFAAVWMHFDSPRRLMTFANFLPPSGTSELPDPNTTGAIDGWKTARAAALDSEGSKYLPHVCLPCHGGTYDPVSATVSGATFLPVDPALVAFSNQPGHDRASSEEAIRAINAMIMRSQPPQPVADYINGLYPGPTIKVGPVEYRPVDVHGTVAQANYVPSGWAQRADFFKSVVKPNCLMCHLATKSPALVFDSAATFFANKALLYAAVCVGRSMPNAELPYNNLWSSLGSSGTVNDGPAAQLFTALGHNGCP